MYEEDRENKIDKRTEIMDDVDEHEGECRQQSSYDAQDVNWTTPNRTSCPEDHAPEKNTSGRASEERTFPKNLLLRERPSGRKADSRRQAEKKLTEMNIVMSTVKHLRRQNAKTAGSEKPLVSQQLPSSLEQLQAV